MAYLLDANTFIDAKNRFYGFDFCPAYWDWILQQSQCGCVFSIEKVGDELAAINDDLSIWAAARGAAFFLQPDIATLSSFPVVSQWVSSGRYTPAAVNTFLQDADYYLVAQAHALGYTVVTFEIPSNSAAKVKIPDACIGVKVKCITPFEMLRLEQARFILK